MSMQQMVMVGVVVAVGVVAVIVIIARLATRRKRRDYRAWVFAEILMIQTGDRKDRWITFDDWLREAQRATSTWEQLWYGINSDNLYRLWAKHQQDVKRNKIKPWMKRKVESTRSGERGSSSFKVYA